jgi:hypothetical protein
MRGHSSNSDPTAALLLLFGGGLWFFFKGFRVMREYKVLDDTPRMPIRSVPMGFVHIRGKAEASKLMNSPVSNTPCCFYKVVVEQWRSKNNGHEWVHYCTDFNGYQFHLADETGKILIDAHAAEYDLKPTVTRVVSSSSPNEADAARLLEYVSSAGVHSMTDRMGQWVDKKFEKARAPEKPELQAKREAFKELFAGMSSFQEGGKAPIAAMQKLFNASGPLSDPKKEQHRQEMLQNLKLAEMASESGLLEQLMHRDKESANGRFRLSEYIVAPGQEYLIDGTCVENNDSATSAQDRSTIAKGANEPTFVISSQSEAQVHQAFKKRSLLMIFGGAAAALIGAFGLLVHFGMF